MKNQDRDRTTKKRDEDDDAIVARGTQDSEPIPSGGRARMNDDVIDEDDDVEPGSRGPLSDKGGGPSPTTRKK